jgi:sugar phosphate permease
MSADPRVRRRRWLIYGVAASIYFVSYVHRVAPAVVAADLMRAFSITAATLGNLAAIYPYTFVVMALVAGSLVDTAGPRWTLVCGGLTMAAGAALFGVAPVFSVAFAGRLLVGLGASVLLIAWLTLLAEWFHPDEFAMVSGSTQVVGNAGALMASTPLALLVEALGWRETFVVIGGVTALLAALAAFVIRDRPESMGFSSLGPRRARAASLADVLRGIPLVIRNARTWAPVLAATGVYATEIAFLGLWGVPYLTQVYGFERVRAANTIALVAVGMMVGSPLIGWISDRWLGRRRLPFIAFAGIYAACWLPLALPGLRPAPTMLGPLFFLIGLSGSCLVLVWACAREVNDPGRVGIVMGFCNAPIFLAFAILQWLMGAILDARWQGLVAGGVRLYPPAAYEAAFTLCLGLAIAALVAATLVTETRCRNVWAAARPGVA